MCRGRSQVMVCTCPSRTPYTSPQSCSRSRSCTCSRWQTCSVLETSSPRDMRCTQPRFEQQPSWSRYSRCKRRSRHCPPTACRCQQGMDHSYRQSFGSPRYTSTHCFPPHSASCQGNRVQGASPLEALNVFVAHNCACARRSRGAGGTIILAVGRLIAAKT